MFRTHSWRMASLVMALTAIVGLPLPALGEIGVRSVAMWMKRSPAPRPSTILA